MSRYNRRDKGEGRMLVGVMMSPTGAISLVRRIDEADALKLLEGFAAQLRGSKPKLKQQGVLSSLRDVLRLEREARS